MTPPGLMGERYGAEQDAINNINHAVNSTEPYIIIIL